ncbi:hypothetical protein ZIOFF_051888 [Zingiber officinale]|uniref:Uncharacterized protein n=1 Tax=Zingiber officinale TaxID=94328 RepID=A0A8J5FMN0_ZINOF|nr:hypothetical protein ZIOFF_051888 [Zingiber officinale]
MKAVAHPVRAALRRVGFGGGPLTGSLRWRRRLLLAALFASAAAAVFLAFSSRPSGAPLWISDSYSTPSSRIADSLSSANFSPVSLPGFASRLNFSASDVTPVFPPVLAPSPPPNDDLDDAEVDDIDSGPVSKETALWTEVMNSTDANLPSLFVEPHPSQLESSKSGTPELREPPLSLQNELRMPMPLTSTDQQLIYAKGEISRAPVIYDDSDLFAPLFLNVSVFKRSYSLMESLLKVYIYQDGSKPIFHRPDLKGIYASEGWFMKLMEGNKNFVVKDPKKAHLFYLPYSAHRGADHFLVACHDWLNHVPTRHQAFLQHIFLPQDHLVAFVSALALWAKLLPRHAMLEFMSFSDFVTPCCCLIAGHECSSSSRAASLWLLYYTSTPPCNNYCRLFCMMRILQQAHLDLLIPQATQPKTYLKFVLMVMNYSPSVANNGSR